MSFGPPGPWPCCDACLPAHVGDWAVRPNPYLVSGQSPPCAFCGANAPGMILAPAAPVDPRAH